MMEMLEVDDSLDDDEDDDDDDADDDEGHAVTMNL